MSNKLLISLVRNIRTVINKREARFCREIRMKHDRRKLSWLVRHCDNILGSVYIKHQLQLCNDTINPVLIENDGVAQNRLQLFWSDSIVFNENRIASVITKWSQHDAGAWSKWTISRHSTANERDTSPTQMKSAVMWPCGDQRSSSTFVVFCLWSGSFILYKLHLQCLRVYQEAL